MSCVTLSVGALSAASLWVRIETYLTAGLKAQREAS